MGMTELEKLELEKKAGLDQKPGSIEISVKNAVDVEKILKQEADRREAGMILIRNEVGEVMEFMKTLKGDVTTMDEYLKKTVKSRKTGISQSAADLMLKDDSLLPSGDDNKRFSISKAASVIMNPTEAAGMGCEYELDISRKTKKALTQALTLDVGSTGGFLVPSTELPEMIELLRANTVVERAGARMLRNLRGNPVTLPRQTTAVTAQWISAGTTLTGQDQVFDQVQLTVKRLAAMTVMDNLTMRLSMPTLDEVVEQDLGMQIALARDLAAIRGDGTDNQPVGVRFTSGVGSVTLNAVPVQADLETLERTLNEANAPNRRRAWIMSPRTLSTIQGIVDASSRPIIQPAVDPSPGRVNQILTYPFFTTTQIPNNLGGGTDESELYLGDWSECMIGEWGALEILASNVAGSAFSSDQTFVRAIMYTDIAIRHAEAFALYPDVRFS